MAMREECTCPALPALLTSEDAVAASMPLTVLAQLLHVGAMVGREVDECVVGEAELIQGIEDLTWRGGGAAVVRQGDDYEWREHEAGG